MQPTAFSMKEYFLTLEKWQLKIYRTKKSKKIKLKKMVKKCNMANRTGEDLYS